MRIQVVLLVMGLVAMEGRAEFVRRPVANTLLGAGRVAGFGAAIGARVVGRTAVAGARIVAGTAIVGGAVVAGTAIVGARIVGRTAVAAAAPFVGVAQGFRAGLHAGRRFDCGPIGCIQNTTVVINDFGGFNPAPAPFGEQPVSRSVSDSPIPGGANFRVNLGGGSCLATMVQSDPVNGCSAVVSQSCVPMGQQPQFGPGSEIGFNSLRGQPVSVSFNSQNTAQLNFRCPSSNAPVVPVPQAIATQFQQPGWN